MQPNFYRKVFVIRNLPQNITENNKDIFMSLLQTPNTTISLHIGNVNANEVKKLVDKQINNTNTGLFKAKVTDQIEARNEIDELTAFYRDCQKTSANGSSMKSVNVFIETYGKDKKTLDENINKLTTKCQSLSISIEECLLRQREGFVGVCPVGTDTRGRLLANTIPSNTFGQLYMFSESSLNDPKGMILGKTIDNGIVSLDVWGRTHARTSSNIVIIGLTGQGKSYLVKKIISQQYPRGTVIFSLDVENEYSHECTELGGTNINCARGNFAINPLQVRYFRNKNDDDEDFDDDIAAFSAENTPFFQHLSWLSDFFKVLIPFLSNNKNTDASMQLSAVKIFVQDLYKKFGIDENTDFTKLSPKDYPIMSDLYNYIYDVMEHREKYDFYRMIDETVIKHLLLNLYEVHKGSLSPLFNKHTNIVNNRFINFNIQELLMGSEDNTQAVLFNILTYIWGRIITRTDNIMLIIDELHLFLNRDNPTIAKYLNTFVRRARKYNASLLTATQKIADCLDEKLAQYTAAILDTPTYKFLFYPGEVESDLLKKKLRLTDGEIASISLPNQGNCLLKVANDKYNLVVGELPFEKALFGKGGGV